MMSHKAKPIAPWQSETNVFEQPNTQCELILEEKKRLVSIALWEGYCYLKVDGLKGLWGITIPYERTDALALAGFVAEQIEREEVGRVWVFPHAFSNYDPVTNTYALNHINEGIVAHARLIAIIRFDNSAIVREEYQTTFVRTPIISKVKRQLTKAKIPSIWHPGRVLIRPKKVGNAARSLVYREIPQEELFNWKQGSISECITLIEALFICASVTLNAPFQSEFINMPWPYSREDIDLPSLNSSKVKLAQFLQIIWDHHHFDTNDWLPARGAYYDSVSNKRYEWKKAGNSEFLRVKRNFNATAHERIEAALTIHNWFKDKISEHELNRLLSEEA